MRMIFSLLGLVVVAALLLWLARGQLRALGVQPRPAASSAAAPAGDPRDVQKKVQDDLQKAMEEQQRRLEQADKAADK
jgi:hypothetical protein